MDKLYIVVAIVISILVLLIILIENIYADPIIHIDIKDTLTIRDDMIIDKR